MRPISLLSAALTVVALFALACPHTARAQDKEPWQVDAGRDVHFDNTLLFSEPWLWPIDLEGLVPKAKTGPKPTYAQSWQATAEFEKRYFLTGYGDLVMFRCLQQFGGDNPRSRACAAPLMPIPADTLLAAIDTIYRDKRYADKRYDLVIQAALRKMVGDDWQGFLAQAK